MLCIYHPFVGRVSFHQKSSPFNDELFGGHAGRDALRKSHGAAFLAKARERLVLERLTPRRFKNNISLMRYDIPLLPYDILRLQRNMI